MKRKLLIIDDDEEMCSELSEILKSEGYDVSTVNDGIKGRDIVYKNAYNLLLLDLKIPGLSGFDILKDLKDHNVALKIIVLSGRPMIKELKNYTSAYNEEEENILKLADEVINKPFDVSNLIEKIGRLVN